jgi:hypothetical protein
MPRNELGELRRSQVVTTFGPGAIVDFRVGGYRGATVSVVAAGLEQWNEDASARGLLHTQRISEPRLEKALRVRGFRLPPVQPDRKVDGDRLAGVRFPRWLQCPRCERLEPDGNEGFWAGDPGDPRRRCPECSSRGRSIYPVPVRLVTACERGHLDDFPWSWWAHGAQPDHQPRLILTTGRASGLASLVVRCTVEGCGANRTLAGAFGDEALPLQCRGRRPWLETDDDCDRRMRAVQRGASNLYFPIVESALSVPPWSDPIQRGLGIYWSDIAAAGTADERRQLVELLRLQERTSTPIDELMAHIEDRLGRLEASPDIRVEEYGRLRDTASSRLGDDIDFLLDPETVPHELRPHLSNLARVTRLREVRALTGFTRLVAYAGPADQDRVAKLSAVSHDWLPAVEIRGEGIFVGLNEHLLAEWEEQGAVQARMHELGSRAPAEVARPLPMAREVLLHTLAHVLMSELALECGYTFAALRERIYGSPSMAGILVYTGSPDSEGTLGGLVRQGEGDRFVHVLLNALRRAEWCANDPLCGDGRLSLSDTRSLAACHACALAPETSCERFNRELDRGLLVGTPGSEAIGFFRPLL